MHVDDETGQRDHMIVVQGSRMVQEAPGDGDPPTSGGSSNVTTETSACSAAGGGGEGDALLVLLAMLGLVVFRCRQG